MYTLHDMPQNERPRERLIKKGPSSLSDYELLAIILRTGNQQLSVLELSKEIIATHGNLGMFNNITIEELKKHKGVKTAKAVEILAAIEFGKRVCNYQNENPTITNATDAYNYIRYDMENLTTEVVKVIYLNRRSQIIEVKTIAMGSIDNTSVDIREILKWSFKLSSHHFIICHNHPSGDPNPSWQDRKFTNELISMASKTGVLFIDHLIIGKNKYYSFSENKTN